MDETYLTLFAAIPLTAATSAHEKCLVLLAALTKQVRHALNTTAAAVIEVFRLVNYQRWFHWIVFVFLQSFWSWNSEKFTKIHHNLPWRSLCCSANCCCSSRLVLSWFRRCCAPSLRIVARVALLRVSGSHELNVPVRLIDALASMLMVTSGWGGSRRRDSWLIAEIKS